jgi:hypothetical protein
MLVWLLQHSLSLCTARGHTTTKPAHTFCVTVVFKANETANRSQRMRFDQVLPHNYRHTVLCIQQKHYTAKRTYKFINVFTPQLVAVAMSCDNGQTTSTLKER